jgi:hypothetical protein
MATLRTAGEIGSCPLLYPFGSGLFLRAGWLRWVQQVAALAESLRLAAVGQEADMTQALKALGQNMQEKAAHELVGRQGHGLAAIALAAIAKVDAYLTVVNSEDAVVDDGHAMGIASEIGEHLLRSCHRLLGIDDPRLLIEGGEQLLQALGGGQGGCVLRDYQGLPALA